MPQSEDAGCMIYGEKRKNDDPVRRWFEKFKDRNFNLENYAFSGQPSSVKDILKDANAENPFNSEAITLTKSGKYRA
ncbi:hypothetical protein NPIL_448771 [Nephila pilipes]|uniref:Uncharacterized protein n=1 Tax=Nephila pilipes TaxID=299642 RepID=A0A8X6U0I0_NEPPI|nr:hypothetical protein NPIL_448771 [Nephila pilipes]